MQTSAKDSAVDNAVAEGGAYELIRKRLTSQSEELYQLTQSLNEDRLDEFGSSDMSVAARVRVRTENNCIARDIAQVGEFFIFGYNVFIGLKKETKLEDVFSLFKLVNNDGEYELVHQKLEGTFLNDMSFASDFEELYRYYKSTKLVQITVKNGKLLASFQIGESTTDLRVFRWAVSADGKEVKYIDNRGEREIQLPSPYDFEWSDIGRDDIVHGKNSHINILDTIFVETTGGDLTIKIENNTETGKGIFSEPVDNATQSLDDASFQYAKVGGLILLKIRPYQEEITRFFIYNTLTQHVLRVDEIGQSCRQLPEDHGIIFPGGHYLQTGEYKTFDEDLDGFSFKRMLKSPNGEDVMYAFYDPNDGRVALLSYNLIEKSLQVPMIAHGHAIADNGELVLFTSEDEPTRIHPM